MWHIVKRKLWTQRSELKMMLVMSAISLMMIFAFGGFNGGYQPTVLISDLDQSDLSAKYISLLSDDKSHQYKVVDSEAGIQEVKENKALGMVTIEKGFGERLENSSEAALTFMSVKTDADTMVLQPPFTQSL